MAARLAAAILTSALPLPMGSPMLPEASISSSRLLETRRCPWAGAAVCRAVAATIAVRTVRVRILVFAEDLMTGASGASERIAAVWQDLSTRPALVPIRPPEQRREITWPPPQNRFLHPAAGAGSTIHRDPAALFFSSSPPPSSSG